MATTLSRMVTCNEELPLIKFDYSSVRWFYEVARQFTYFIYIFTSNRPMFAKHGKMLSYREGLPLINLCNPEHGFFR